MNDLDLVREMRADAPEPSADQLAGGRRRLHAAIHSPAASAARSRPALFRRPALLAGGLAVTAAAAAVAATAGGSGPDGHVTTRPSPLRLTAATEVLNKAAQTVEKQPEPVLKPHQWIYYKFSQYGRGAGVKTDESWERLDGMQDADVMGSKVVVHRKDKAAEPKEDTPLGAYQLLASLPTDPHAMLATLYDKVGSKPGSPGSSRDERAFENIQQLLWNSEAGAPPRIQAALYRALAQLPGVKVQANVEYAPGRTAIGVSDRPDSALLLDPKTYRMIGSAYISTGARQSKARTRDGALKKGYSPDLPVQPAGTVLSAVFRSTVTFVSAPGNR
ncbi:hypothetical protein GCM10023196_083840 [Actinoallomurus vinaceus]|uniref:CU044_5270 family protein n=1 Tax=Actinoallomurus vinaceus TaxID=1080074 RepID=A0ABP8UP85_9ACTN